MTTPPIANVSRQALRSHMGATFDELKRPRDETVVVEGRPADRHS